MTLARRMGAWPALGLVLLAAAIVLIAAGRGLSFSGDDFSYYGREVLFTHTSQLHFDSMSLEYLLIPHNGHLQLGGKLVYEGLFAIFGSDYVAFRIVGVIGVLACVVLFFALARRRVGDVAALLGSILIAFLGAAWEVLIWPFDLHTTFALAAGLGALLALELRRRHSDLAACLLLVASCMFIEVGLVFVAAVASAILLEEGWRRRIWIAATPAFLFGVWFIWAHQYDFPATDVDIPGLIPSMFRSAGATAAALTGRLSTGAGADVNAVGQSGGTTVLGVVLVALVVTRVAVAGFRRTLVPPLVALGVYWCFIAFSQRPEDSSRYVFVGTVLALLVVAEALRGWRPAPWAVAVLVLIVALALPPNFAKLGDGAGSLRRDAVLTTGELAMMELAGTRGDPDYQARLDPFAVGVGASPYIDMTTADYLEALRFRGSISASLDEVRSANVFERTVFDSVLAGAVGIRITPSQGPSGNDRCARAGGEDSSPAQLPFDGAIVRVAGNASVPIGVSRFTTEHSARYLGKVKLGEWQRIGHAGADEAPEPWLLFTEGQVEICPV